MKYFLVEPMFYLALVAVIALGSLLASFAFAAEDYGVTDELIERQCREWAAQNYPADAGWTAREISLEASKCFEIRKQTRDANATAL